MRLWIPLTWRKGDYINLQGKPVRKATHAIVVSGRSGIMLGHRELVLRITLVKPRKPVEPAPGWTTTPPDGG